MKAPLVAIIGRPNVGKSTLFNRLVGSRKAIVGDEPGITRDRMFGEVDWKARVFRLVDTGGIVPDDDAIIPTNIFKQASAAIDEAGMRDRFDEAMARSEGLWEVLGERFPERASYAVSLAYRIRYAMQFNAREAMHLIELRTSIQGHPSYRAIGQRMHHLIAERAGHQAIAEMMRFVDHSGEAELERLGAERRAEARRGDSA